MQSCRELHSPSAGCEELLGLGSAQSLLVNHHGENYPSKAKRWDGPVGISGGESPRAVKRMRR